MMGEAYVSVNDVDGGANGGDGGINGGIKIPNRP